MVSYFQLQGYQVLVYIPEITEKLELFLQINGAKVQFESQTHEIISD
jgi:hypothetical protein